MRMCVFCGQPGTSREHVIEQQLGEALKASRPLAADMRRIGLIQKYTPPAGQEDTAFDWASTGPELVTTDVCPECNNEWLARIGDRAMPSFFEMVLGLSRVLPAQEQRALATWAYKTVLLMERVRPGASFKVIPQERYIQLPQAKGPPSDVRIWLGATTTAEAVVHSTARRAPMTTLSSSHAGYIAILTVGQMLVVAAGRSSESPEPLQFSARSEGRSLVQVWPASLQARQWPPARVTEDLTLEGLAALV